jgi:hypothetical protein
LWFKASLDKKVHETPISINKSWAWRYLLFVPAIIRKITVQAGSGIKQDLFQKITKAKRATGMAHMVESLLSKHKALISNPSERERKRERENSQSL